MSLLDLPNEIIFAIAGASNGLFFANSEADLEEYNHPSELTTPKGLPLPVTDEVLIRDAVIGQFIKHGADINTILHENEYSSVSDHLLHYTAWSRNEPAFLLLVKHGADIFAVNEDDNHTALQSAATGGCAKLIRFLISRGADVNARDWEEKTPFQFAAEEGHVAAMRLLFEAGADINAQDEDGYTPLHLMMMNGKPAPDTWMIPALKTMFSLGPDTELGMFEDNKTPLHVAILNQRDTDFPGDTAGVCRDGPQCADGGRADAAVLLCGEDEEGRSILQVVLLEGEDCAYVCLPDLLIEGLYTLDSDAGDGKTLRQFLKERGWAYTVEDRVEGITSL